MPRLSVIALALIVGLAIWYHNKYNAASTVQDEPVIQKVDGTVEPEIKAAVTSLSPSATSSPTFEKKTELCGFFETKGSNLSLSDLRTSFDKIYGPPVSEVINWENTHLITPSGEKLRLRLVRVSDQQTGRAELQLFGVDKEDLPLPKRIPKADQFDPSRETIRKYKSMGRIEHTQKEMVISWPQDTTLRLQIEDGKIVDLSGSKGLERINCSQGKCSCLRP